jgi:PAS domain S-box-containing protein
MEVKSTILIRATKQIQKQLSGEVLNVTKQLVTLVDSTYELKKITRQKKFDLIIYELDKSEKNVEQVIKIHDFLLKKGEPPILYIVDDHLLIKSLCEKLEFCTFDIIQKPASSDLIQNKIRLHLSNLNTKKELNRRNAELVDEITDHIKTKIDLKKQVRRLKEQQNYLEVFIESIPIPVFIKDSKGFYTKWNKAFEKFLELDKKDIEGKKAEDYAEVETVNIIYDSDKEVFGSRKEHIFQGTYRRTNGMEYEVVVHKKLLPGTKRGEEKLIGTIFDLTSMQKAEKILKIQHTINYLASLKKGLRFALKNILNQVFELEWVDAGGIYLYHKDKDQLKLEYYIGLSEEFVKSVKIYDRNTPQFELVSRKKPMFEKYEKVISETKTTTADESIHLISILPLVNDENNELVGCLNLGSRKFRSLTDAEKMAAESIAKKMTNLILYAKTQEDLKKLRAKLESKIEERTKELQEANKQIVKINKTLEKRIKNALKEQHENQQYLIHKSKLESLGELAAGIAHEINQPLGILSLSFENLQAKIVSNTASADYVKHKIKSIDSNIKRIRDIIEHVKVFSREQAIPALDKISINKVVNNALSLLKTQYTNHNIKIITNLKSDIGFTVGSKIKLEQAIMNLLANAKYAVEDKAIYYSEDEYSKTITINTGSTSKKIILSIEDNGIGIKKDHLNRVFDPFFTTKPEGIGTGLGLSIVYGTVKEMFGDIRVDSKEGKFTKFEILFPRFPEND